MDGAWSRVVERREPGRAHVSFVLLLFVIRVEVDGFRWVRRHVLTAWQYRAFHKEYSHHKDCVSCVVYVPITDRVWAGSFDKSLSVWKML